MFAAATPAPVPPALAPISVAATDGLSFASPSPTRLRARIENSAVLIGHDALVRGSLSSSRPALTAGRQVKLQLLRSRGWYTVSRARTGRGGGFSLRYAPQALDADHLRVLYSGDANLLASRERVGTVTAFRLAVASWYGGGGPLACGGWLTSSTLGVANKTLPCGTMVTLRFGGRSVRVPVVDRGPFVPGREFDLTEATRNALGFSGVGVVWSSR